jgi:TetR/AcrR family transcriptional repressor of lmrAB and yxaGH operons
MKPYEGYSRLGIESLAAVAKEAGSATTQARAEEARVKIEGSLVISRILDDTAAFERTLRNLRDFLTFA